MPQELFAGKDAYKNHVAEIEALLSQIDPNDTLAFDMGLTERFIRSKCQYGFHSDDVSAMSSEFIDVVNNYITTPKIRHKFFNDIASFVFNAELSTKIFDLDAFWEKYCRFAPKQLVDYYQTVVDSKHTTAPGAKCPDATFMDINGNSHSLYDFIGKGKYLYIDLWATWCGPCCAEIPYLEKHVAHYKDNDRIQFISISIDNDKQAWRSKLEKDKPQWAQFVTRTKEEYQKLSSDWGITGIPRFIIINPDGTINNNAAFRPSDPNFTELLDAIITNTPHNQP